MNPDSLNIETTRYKTTDMGEGKAGKVFFYSSEGRLETVLPARVLLLPKGTSQCPGPLGCRSSVWPGCWRSHKMSLHDRMLTPPLDAVLLQGLGSTFCFVEEKLGWESFWMAEPEDDGAQRHDQEWEFEAWSGNGRGIRDPEEPPGVGRSPPRERGIRGRLLQR